MRIVELPKTLPPDVEQGIGRIRFPQAGDRVVAQSGFYKKGERQCIFLDTFHVVDIASGKVKTARPEESGAWLWPALSADGRLAATSLHYPGGVNVLRLWAPWSRGPERGLRLPPGLVSAAWLAFAPDGPLYVGLNPTEFPRQGNHARLLRVDPDWAVRRFDDPDAPNTPEFPPGPGSIEPKPVLEGAVEPVAALGRLFAWHSPPAFTPDGQRLAAWSEDGPALVLESGSGRLIQELPWEGPDARVPTRQAFRLALSPDGEQVAMVGRGLVICRRLGENGEAWRTRKAAGYVTDAAFHPDGRTLSTVNAKGQAHRFDARTGRLVESFDWQVGLLLCVALSPTGSVGAAGGRENKLVLWDIDI
jgi:WD40 repeat protein